MELLFSPIARGDCPLCGAAGRVVHENLKDVLYGAPGVWGFRSCSNGRCGLIWQDPTPHARDLALAYASYYTHDAPVDPSQSGARRPGGLAGRAYLTRRFNYPLATHGYVTIWLSRFLCLLPRLSARLDDFVGHLSCEPGGTLLEIGCGNGSFMQAMRALGWTVTGVELDPRSARIGLAAGLDVRQGDLISVDLPAGSFSAVVMRHVFEHVTDPLETLTRCLSLLRPGGRLVITTPNPRGIGHRLFRSAWRGLEPPRHLHLFGPTSIRSCLERAGFTGVACRSTAHWADGILRQSVLIRLPALRRTIAGKAVAAGIGGAIAQVEVVLRPLWQFCGEELLATALRPLDDSASSLRLLADEVAAESPELTWVEHPESGDQHECDD